MTEPLKILGDPLRAELKEIVREALREERTACEQSNQNYKCKFSHSIPPNPSRELAAASLQSGSYKSDSFRYCSVCR